MTSRERVIKALNHEQPDRCPIDLGSCGQTGMNISTLYRLRKALGLDEHRLKAVEPYQMLGEIEEDLRQAVHSDVVGLFNRGNMMGFLQQDWKPFDLDDGTPTWMGGGFEYDVNEKGDKMVYACGDRSCKYALCMPKGGFFFDNLDHFDVPFDMEMDEEDLTPEQLDANLRLIRYLYAKYPTIRYIFGHYQQVEARESGLYIENVPDYYSIKPDPGPIFMRGLREGLQDTPLVFFPE